MADKRMQPTWDPIALAAQLRNIARQSQVLMRHFVSHQPDAIKFGMGQPQPWRLADRTCCVVWRTFFPIWSAAMAGLRLR